MHKPRHLRIRKKTKLELKLKNTFKDGENSPTEDMAGNVVINTAAEQVFFIKVM